MNIDAQDAQDFSGNGQLVIPSIRKSAHDHCRTRLLVQMGPVLVILCILCIHVNYGSFAQFAIGANQNLGADRMKQEKQDERVLRSQSSTNRIRSLSCSLVVRIHARVA